MSDPNLSLVRVTRSQRRPPFRAARVPGIDPWGQRLRKSFANSLRMTSRTSTAQRCANQFRQR
jgi:hypothetical protein